MKPLHERIAEAVNAIAEASSANKQACLQALTTHFAGLLAEVQTLESKQAPTPPP